MASKITRALSRRLGEARRTNLLAHRPLIVHAGMKSWMPRDEEALQHAATTALMHEYTQMQLKTAETLVPWFLDELPEAYFRSVSEADRLQHLRAISALHCHEGEDELKVVTCSENERVVTFARSGNKPGVLLRQVQQLGRESGRLSQVSVFTSRDCSLCINVFVFDTTKREQRLSSSNKSAARIAELWGPHESYAARLVGELGPDDVRSVEFFAPTKVRAYLAKCRPSYLAKVRPQRLWQQRELWECVRDSEAVRAQLVRADPDFDDVDERGWWIQLAAPSIRPRGFLQRILKVINAAKLSVERCHLDVIDGVSLFRILVATPVGDNNNFLHGDYQAWSNTLHTLQRLKWLDDDTLEVALAANPVPRPIDLARAETRTALCALAHARLAGNDAIAYSRAAIAETAALSRYVGIANDVADLVLRRTAPELFKDGNAAEAVRDDATASLLLKERICKATAGVDNAAKRVLDALVDVASAVEASNAQLEQRLSLAMSLDPASFLRAGQNDTELEGGDVPHSIMYVHARRFGGYHVRFRKIARGGVRLVTPRSPESLAWERSRHFDECFGLASAQQLKNKDIPEGGSKAVILVDTLTKDGREDDIDDVEHDCKTLKHYACRQSVKAFTDGLLDLVLSRDERTPTVEKINEHLYLGPDEQILSEDIEWTVENARRRGHPTPDAFMSSKADVGINHKEFGVTSEGVVVYVEAALNSIGIDPRSEAFRVKLTGGPDGDVAGNCIKFLFREFGNNARIVGVADGSGCAEDLEGLDQGELLRLVEAGLPIVEFEPARLGPDGAIHDASTDAGTAARDSMHARIPADVFVPAGGRPGTLNAQNNDAFFVTANAVAQSRKRPSSPLIVEGANLFLTPEARLELYRRGGVRVVKDSSANKGGVISSSFEILSAHILDRAEFEELKPRLVQEIVDRIRSLARLEASLLFREFSNYPTEGGLPEISMRISQCINHIKDAVISDMEQNGDHQAFTLFTSLAPEHLPPTLAMYAIDRIHRLPQGYVAAAVASFVASRLVYSEGINFCETLPKERLAQIALDFVDAQRRTEQAVSAVKSATGLDDAHRDAIIRLLNRGGARASLDL